MTHLVAPAIVELRSAALRRPYRINLKFRTGAILHAQSIAKNLRSKNTLIRPNMRVCVINEKGLIVHEENVFR